MYQNPDSINTLPDPKYLLKNDDDIFDYSMLLDKLSEIELMRPSKKYASIFYEKYIKNCTSEILQKTHNISYRELNTRLLDIINYFYKQKI